MKRFLRWFMVAIALLTILYWPWSVWHYFSVLYQGSDAWSIGIVTGKLYMGHTHGLAPAPDSFKITHNYQTPPMSQPKIAWGLQLPTFESLPHSAVSNGHRLMIPLWLLFLMESLIGAFLWYRPFKAWRHGTDRKGFDVETIDKKNERDSTELAEVQDAKSAKV